MSTSNRNFAIVLAALAAVALAPSAQAIPEGAPDRGFWLGGTANISPFLDIFWYHDDNPDNARNQKSELLEENNVHLHSSNGYSVRPGFNLDVPGNCWKLAGRAFYSLERYSRDDVDDRNDWGESLAFSGETDAGLMWRLDESIIQVDLEEQYVEDFPYNYSTRDRLEMGFGGSRSKRITDKSRLEIGGSDNKTDYDARNMFDYTRYGGRLSYAHKLTERTDWTLSATHSIYEQDSNDEGTEGGGENKSTKLMLGAKTRSTERLSFDVHGGVEFYQGDENEDGTDNDKTSFTYALSGSWKAGERLTIGFHGLGEYEPAEDIGKNSVDAKSIGINASYRPFERWLLSAGITYRREEYVRRIAKITDTNGNPYSVNDFGTDRHDDVLDLNGRIVFRLNHYASLFASCTYHDVSSSIHDFGYERTRYSLGAAFRY